MIAATKVKVVPETCDRWPMGRRLRKPFDTINPATGEVLTQIAEAQCKDVDRAVIAARKAFDDTDRPVAQDVGQRAGQGFCGGWLTWSKKTSKNWPNWKLWITASRFSSHDTWTSRW